MSMHQKILRSSLAIAVAGLAASSLALAPATAATVLQVRPADLVLVPGTVSGTTGTAKADFLAEGIHIQTENATDGVRGYWNIPGGVPLSQVHTVQYEWFGTPLAQPGLAYNIDVDGDRKPDAQFIGELGYGGRDVWLNRDAEDFTGVTPTVPAGFFASRSPCSGANTPQNGNVDGCGASGAAAHGTLDDWVRSLAGAGRTANVISAGYIAVGLVYDGVLRSSTVGPDQFVFTDAPKAAVTVKAKAAKATVKTGSKIKVTGSAKPVGPGAKVRLQVKKNDTWKTKAEKALAADGAYKLKMNAPGKPGTVKLRVVVTETNSTASGKSANVKVKVVK
jgi:hypothetical protein